VTWLPPRYFFTLWAAEPDPRRQTGSTASGNVQRACRILPLALGALRFAIAAAVHSNQAADEHHTARRTTIQAARGTNDCAEPVAASRKTFRLTRTHKPFYIYYDSIMNDLIILAALLPGASYGYAIKKTAGRAFGYSELHSNVVYPLLRKFVEEGWVEQSFKPGERGQQRKQYRLTPTGRAELVRRLERFEDETVRDRGAFLLRVSLFGMLSPAARHDVLEKRRAYLERRLEQLRSLESKASSSRFGGLVLSFSLSGMEHEIAWLEQVERQLQTRPKGKSTRKDKQQ
jgi:DNA-binding PadR family transcriptional regulator